MQPALSARGGLRVEHDAFLEWVMRNRKNVFYAYEAF